MANNFVVEAPDFDDPSKIIRLGINASWVNENKVAGRYQRIFDFWPLIRGVPPPVNNIGYHEGGDMSGHIGLMGTHAMARGLERPIGDADNGDGIYVLLSKPTYHYEYEVGMVCLAKRLECPKN
ncbi:MAG: hypothetical protein GXP05_11700, partial [Alphaproteobacteria bacterium]|nr:hypothetical protein [Alphaproteobacteria bacterium]